METPCSGCLSNRHGWPRDKRRSHTVSGVYATVVRVGPLRTVPVQSVSCVLVDHLPQLREVRIHPRRHVGLTGRRESLADHAGDGVSGFGWTQPSFSPAW